MKKEELQILISQLPERYEVLDELGHGGFGVILKAKDTTLDKTVAVKMLLSKVEGERAVRFHSEAKALGKLNHTNISTALDFQITDTGTPFLVLDFIDGQNLEDYLKEHGPLDVEDALFLIEQMALALEYAHGEDVIHRDIKPSNVMLVEGEDGETTVKLVDFGLSKLEDDDQHLTTTGVVMGSPLYMSPEQAQGKRVGIESDIYSLGCLFYMILTGRPPFRGETALATLADKQSQTAPRLSEGIDREFPESLENIVAKMLATDPADRYRTIADLRVDLKQLEPDTSLQESGQDFEPESEPREETSSGRGSRVVILLAVTVCVLAGAFLVANLIGSKKQKKVAKKIDLIVYETALLEETKIVSGDFDRNNEPCERLINKSKLVEYKFEKVASDSQFKNYLKNRDDVEALDLKHTSLGSDCLEFLSNTKNKDRLVDLVLDDSGQGNQALKYVARFKNLKRLNLTACQRVTDEGIGYIAELENLDTIRVADTGIGLDGFRKLAAMPSLVRIDMRNVKSLNADVMKALSKSSRIKKLEFAGSNVGEEIFRSLHSIEGLQNLVLDAIEERNLTAGVKYLPDVALLRTVEIRDCKKLPRDLGQTLGSIKELKNLTIKNCPVDENVLSGLDKAKHLTNVWIEETDLSKSMNPLRKLSRMKGLQRLKLDRSAIIFKDVLDSVITPQFTDLDSAVRTVKNVTP